MTLVCRYWKYFLGLPIALSVLAGWLAQRDIFARLPGYLWGAAVILCLVAGYLHDHTLSKSTEADDESHISLSDLGLAWATADWILAVGVFVVALLLRLYRLSEVLPPVHGDEGEMGMLALLALHGPVSGIHANPLPLFSTAFLDHPTLFHYLQALCLRLFGESLVGLRMLSVVVGALCAPAAYAIARAGWGRLSGFIAGWLLAVSHLHIHYSRIALNNIETVLFTMLLVWLLILLDRNRQPHIAMISVLNAENLYRPLLPAISAGLIMGIGQYFYYGSRLMPVVAIPLIFHLWRQRTISVAQIRYMLIAVAVAIFPQALHYYFSFITLMNRFTGVSVLSKRGMLHTLGPTANWPGDMLQLLWHQVHMNLEFFIWRGDHSAFYLADLPGFDPVTVVLFWLGVGIALRQRSYFPAVALLVWFALGVFLAGVVTIDAPNGPRLIVIAPAVYCLAGLTVHTLVQRCCQVWSMSRRIAEVTVGVTIAIVTLCLNYHTYFVQYRSILPNVWQVSLAREIADGAATHRAYLLGTPHYFVEHGTVRFIARAAEKFNVAQHEEFQATVLQQPPNKGALVIALPHQRTELDHIERLFPHGRGHVQYDPQGNVMYFTYRISAQQLATFSALDNQ